MAEDKASARDELTFLAEITEILDKSEIIKKGFTSVIELEEEDYRQVQKLFRDVDKASKKFVVEISDYSFTFVLKK